MTDEIALKPVVSFATGVIGESVALQLDAASTTAQLALAEGDADGFALTADGAIELGQALIERGELAKRGGSKVN